MGAIRGFLGAAAVVLRSALTCLAAAIFLAGLAGRAPAHAAADRRTQSTKAVASIPSPMPLSDANR